MDHQNSAEFSDHVCCLSFFRVNIVYIDKDGTRHKVRGKVGDNVLYLAHRYDISMEGKHL